MDHILQNHQEREYRYENMCFYQFGSFGRFSVFGIVDKVCAGAVQAGQKEFVIVEKVDNQRGEVRVNSQYLSHKRLRNLWVERGSVELE